MSCLSSKKLGARCIASVRTYPEFIKKYEGNVFQYSPVPSENYGGLSTEADYLIDDYRNPVCAAISLAYRWNVKFLLLLFCDSVYAEEKPGMEKLSNGFWSYPQQI